ncbi:protealysin inhibitor emfourin [Mycolicibacterium litorale]|uniref:protealysin inhibitor emfourin n=1 Tax=Mycolicibacterium litorale TaxID=758802 RepID=UPI003CF1754A
MRVSLQTHGGLLGGLGRSRHVVDTESLAPEDRQELAELIAAAESSLHPPPPVNRNLRDAQTYVIEIDDGGAMRTLEATDGSVPAEFARLRDWLSHR